MLTYEPFGFAYQTFRNTIVLSAYLFNILLHLPAFSSIPFWLSLKVFCTYYIQSLTSTTSNHGRNRRYYTLKTMQKFKTVRSDGRVTVTKTEERYPSAANILMGHGFGIILLNMTLGLLPVTVWGTRMKYFKCSISQLYTSVFLLCFAILSVIFVPVAFFPRTDETTVTNFVILVMLGVAHVAGYIVLIIRGHYVAYRIPKIWLQLCKLLQLSVIDVYGKNCYLLKEATKFTRWAVCEYIGITVTTMFSIAAFSIDYSNVFEDSRKHYKLDYVLGQYPGNFELFQAWTFRVGYFIWQLCSFSHVLVSMLLCFFVIIITICLKSINEQIQEFMEKINNGYINGLRTSDIKFDTVDTVEFSHGSSKICTLDELGQEKVIKKMDTIKTILLITEDLTTTISTVWGISLIVEALILIAAGTINTFNFLSAIQNWDEDRHHSRDPEVVSVTAPASDLWISLLITVSIHFYFLFKLASKVNEMVLESKASLNLLKHTPYQNVPPKLQEKIQMLKQDLASTSISLSASNYFQINKYLITAITSQCATYIIVLLQFAQQEVSANNKASRKQ